MYRPNEGSHNPATNTGCTAIAEGAVGLTVRSRRLWSSRSARLPTRSVF